MAKQLLFAHEVPGGARPVGRPHLMWADLVRADLEARRAQLGGRRWYDVAQNRGQWASVVEVD